MVVYVHTVEHMEGIKTAREVKAMLVVLFIMVTGEVDLPEDSSCGATFSSGQIFASFSFISFAKICRSSNLIFSECIQIDNLFLDCMFSLLN